MIFSKIKLYLAIGAVSVVLASSGAAYYFWDKNNDLKKEVETLEAERDALKDARVRDAAAAQKLIEAIEASKARLFDKLTTLEGLTDEDTRDYLDTAVPDSVRRLFAD